MKARTFAMFIIAVAALQACGGGGGGGGNGSGGNAPGSFTVSATTVKFTAKENESAGTPQVVHVHLQDTKAAALGAAYVSPQQQPSWLHVAITGGAQDYDVTLSVISTTQMVGTQSATLTLGTTDSAGNVLHTQAVQTSLTILVPMGVDKPALSGSFVLGDPVTSSTLAVSITADPSTQWKITPSAPWISASAATGTGSGSVNFTIDASGLSVGQTTGTVTVTNSTDPADTATIAVNVTVSNPSFSLAPSPIVIGGNDGLTPGTQTLEISLGTGSNAYPWSATVQTTTGGSWLHIGSSSGAVGGSGTSISVDGDYASISPGSYSGTVQIQATVKGVILTQSVPVTLNKEGHWLYVSSQGAAFSRFPSRSVLTRTLQISSSQNRTDVPWAATSDQSWLSVTASGVTGGALVLTANPGGLQADREYIANVSIASSNGSILNTQSVRVGLWVGSADPGDATVSGTFPYVVANPVEPYVYASDGAGNILVYQVYSGALVNTLATSLAQTTEMAISSDGTQLFVSDATNLEVVQIDPTSGATIRHFPWGSSYSRGIGYARPAAHPILVLGSSAVYNIGTGAKYQATVTPMFFESSYSFASDPSSKYLYTQDNGTSPSTLTQFTLSYSALLPDGLTVSAGPTASGGSNGQDICVSADGSKVYTANGAPYQFSAFSTSGLQPAQTLAAVPYPNTAKCGWNGEFVGGADATYNATDVWVYRPDGTLVITLNMNPTYYYAEILQGSLALSGDNTRIIGGSGVPSLDFHNLPPP